MLSATTNAQPSVVLEHKQQQQQVSATLEGVDRDFARLQLQVLGFTSCADIQSIFSWIAISLRHILMINLDRRLVLPQPLLGVAEAEIKQEKIFELVLQNQRHFQQVCCDWLKNLPEFAGMLVRLTNEYKNTNTTTDKIVKLINLWALSIQEMILHGSQSANLFFEMCHFTDVCQELLVVSALIGQKVREENKDKAFLQRNCLFPLSEIEEFLSVFATKYQQNNIISKACAFVQRELHKTRGYFLNYLAASSKNTRDTVVVNLQKLYVCLQQGVEKKQSVENIYKEITPLVQRIVTAPDRVSIRGDSKESVAVQPLFNGVIKILDELGLRDLVRAICVCQDSIYEEPENGRSLLISDNASPPNVVDADSKMQDVQTANNASTSSKSNSNITIFGFLAGSNTKPRTHTPMTVTQSPSLNSLNSNAQNVKNTSNLLSGSDSSFSLSNPASSNANTAMFI
jgi:hypothetical protein